jgi:copper homeostasis protein
MELNKKLIDAAGEMSVTFHRAFDMCRDPFESLENIIALGCSRILTSGQQPTAEQGIPLIKKLIKQANNRIIIMPGCGINENNIRKIALETGAQEFHLSLRNKVSSKMIYRNPSVSMGGTNITIDEYQQDITDAHRVSQALAALLD